MIDPLYLFVLAGLFSPGPNVILLTASGARFGFKATVPHILGVAAGVGITAGITGFGVGAVLESQPTLQLVLKIVAAGWILYMAFALWNSTKAGSVEAGERPFTFVQAVLFQWVNPKVWAVALAASSGYASGLSPLSEAIRLGTAFSGINLGVCTFWTFAGSVLAYLLGSPTAWRFFMRTMAVILGSFAILIFL